MNSSLRVSSKREVQFEAQPARCIGRASVFQKSLNRHEADITRPVTDGKIFVLPWDASTALSLVHPGAKESKSARGRSGDGRRGKRLADRAR